jgi:hypothetical protein
MNAGRPIVRAKFRRDAGIALGPILFIIAILAILAAAIAAGSGSFNASTTAEGNKTKASAIIQIGDNLKVGMDRLTMENSVLYNAWTISPLNTQNSIDLFSPIGGGVSPPSTAMAGNPASDAWLYPQGAIQGLGTYASNSSNTLQLAVLNITSGVCAEINNRANGAGIAPAAAALGNFAAPAGTAAVATAMNTGWPVAATNTTVVNLYGKPIGCVNNNNGGSSGYYFYEVLYVQ